MMESQNTPSRHRKNGRLQACDPCRRRKVACDHVRPICGSCKRRRRPERCEFTMGAPAQMQPPAPDSGSEGTEQQPLTGTTAAAEYPATNSPLGQNRESTEHQSPPQSRPDDSTAVFGHLGFTSFRDIYQEVGKGLSDQDARPSRTQHTGTPTTKPLLQNTINELPPSATTLETCLAVLRAVPEERKGRALFASYFDPHDAFIRPVAQRAIDSLYETYNSHLGPADERDDARLSELVRVLCRNTTRPFSEHEADAEAWMAQFTGTNIRWETLGLLFIFWELSARNEHRVRPETRPSALQGRAAAFRLRDACRRCINDCLALARRATEVGNTLLLYVYWKRTIVASIVSGDTSLSCWMYNGEAVSMTTFLGLHVEPSKGPYKPTLVTELRRRLACKIFVIDKTVASITGRPPMLSRRYMLTPPPLDLKDEYLVADEATLARAVAALDANGYNTDGVGYPVTFWRARFQLMVIRDEIFEISLGAEAVTTTEALYDLKNRELEAAAKMPAILHFKESDIRDPDVNSEKLYMRMIMRLEHLQNIFFIERLLNRRGCDNGRELLWVSYELTSTTLMFWTNMDGLSMVYGDFQWLVMAYAAPGGGILCLELLKPRVTLDNSRGDEADRITRSSIVQLLSLLVGFLNWVSLKEANGTTICANCMDIVQRVLDEALNVAPGRGGPAMDWGVSAHLDFNFDLLDTFEWTRPEFAWGDLTG